jgi:hypothetical protein
MNKILLIVFVVMAIACLYCTGYFLLAWHRTTMDAFEAKFLSGVMGVCCIAFVLGAYEFRKDLKKARQNAFW